MSGAHGIGCTFYVNVKEKLALIESEPKISLCLIVHYFRISWGRMEIWLHSFLNSVLDGGELTASLQGRFNSEEIVCGTISIIVWEEFRACQDV
jgi:hypothetical protein